MTPKDVVDADLRAVMGGPVGRRFMRRLLEQAGLYSSSFTSEASGMAYNEGRRSVAIALMRELHRVCPEDWVRMVREQLAEQEQTAHGAGSK